VIPIQMSLLPSSPHVALMPRILATSRLSDGVRLALAWRAQAPGAGNREVTPRNVRPKPVTAHLESHLPLSIEPQAVCTPPADRAHSQYQPRGSVQVGALHKAGGNGYGQLPLDT
jgi:hypothetical protein